MRDGRVDVLESGCGIKKTVTIDTHRHALGKATAFHRFPQKAKSPSESPELLDMECAECPIVPRGYSWLLLERVTEPYLHTSKNLPERRTMK